MVDNGLKCPLFILDASFMKELIEGKGSFLRNETFKEIIRRRQENLPMAVYTTESSFKRAMFLSSDETKVKNIKFIMTMVKFFPSKADYKNAAEVSEELKKFSDLVSRGEL